MNLRLKPMLKALIHCSSGIVLSAGLIGIANAQSGASPFGGKNISKSNDLDDKTARSAIAQSKRGKMRDKHLDTVLTQGGGDLIVEYQPTGVSAAALMTKSGSADINVNKRVYKDTKQRVKQKANGGDVTTLRDFDALPVSLVRVNSRKAMVDLLNNNEVKAVYENIRVQPTLAYGRPLIGQLSLFQSGILGVGPSALGEGTTAVVIDTGVNYRYPNVFGACTAPGVPSNTCKFTASFDMTATNDGELDDFQVYDAPGLIGHGTYVGGIIRATAPGTKIISLDVFEKPNVAKPYSARNFWASTSNILAAVNWAINNKEKYNIVVMNLSIGSSSVFASECSGSALEGPFQLARSKGIVPVVSAGNRYSSNGLSWPACTPGAVSVGAVDDQSDTVTSYSNSANYLTLLAPSRVSFVTIPGPGDELNGTSFSAPYVAGAVAMLRANNARPYDSVEQTVARLTSTGKQVSDYRNGVSKPRLNMFAAGKTTKEY